MEKVKIYVNEVVKCIVFGWLLVYLIYFRSTVCVWKIIKCRVIGISLKYFKFYSYLLVFIYFFYIDLR